LLRQRQIILGDYFFAASGICRRDMDVDLGQQKRTEDIFNVDTEKYGQDQLYG